jgi:hypothetical protein
MKPSSLKWMAPDPKYCRSSRAEMDEIRLLSRPETLLAIKIGIGGSLCKSIERSDGFYRQA